MDKKTTPTQEVIDALDLSNSQVASVDFLGSDPRGDSTYTDVASNFPQKGESYLVLSSGCAGAALDPNDEGDFSCDISGDGPGEATDIVRMELELNVPSDASTVQFDLKYLSEEFPEFVGSSFNDSFVVEMGQSTFTVDSNFNLIAPDNLVFDSNGNPITINTTGATGMSSGGAVGTTYDGGTNVLTTTIQLPSDQSTVKLIFSIFDVADEVWDSTIFLDNMRFQESQDLELVGLETNQAIQDWQNSVQLIEDKSTTVRAFIQSQTSSSAPVGNVRLQGFQGGNPLPGSPLSPSNGGSFQAPPQTSNTSTIRNRRADMSKSLNFKLPSSWLNGTVDLQLTGGTVDCSPAAATNDACEFQVDFTSVPTPQVRFARIKWTDSGGTTHIPSQAHVREQAKRIIAMYPIPTMNWSTFTLDWSKFSKPSPPQLGDVNSVLQFVRTLSILFGGSSSAMYYGDMVGTNNGGLAAGIPADVASGDQQVADNVAAHELGHVLNQQHSVNQGDNGTTTGNGQTWKLGYCGPNRAVANTSAPEYPFTNSSKDIAALGPMQQGLDNEMWGLSTRTNTPVDPQNHGDLMSYCAFNFGFNWTSSWRYNKLRTDPNAIADRFSSTSNTSEPKQLAQVKLIRGQINFEETTAEFNSFQTVEAPESAIETITPPSGNYTLRLLDSEDNVVDEVPFAPAENHGFGTGIPETATFLVPAPENAEVNEVRLLAPDENSSSSKKSQIASITASPNPPTTTVDFPNGGEDLSGETATFEWTASDQDEDELDYTVEYSRDGGSTWTALVTDWPQTSIEVDLSTLGQTQEGLIRVRASDGFNSVSDASDGTFTVPNSPPQPFINTPDGSTFDSTSVIPLEGNVNDIEDDQFDDANLSWTSSIDGDLGTGRTLNVGGQLSVGTHTITFSATDSDGATGEASIELSVTPSAGTGLGETPVAVEKLLVDGDGSKTFGGTGVKINFSGVSSSDSVTVEKFDSAPVGGSEIAEENKSQFRYVIEAGPNLSFGSDTEVRFMLSTVSGVSDDISEGDVVIYSRPDEGTGQFSALTTMLDDKGDDDPSNDELFATVDSFSEFALASDSEPLPVEISALKGTTVEENRVRLTWQTASETNNAGFEVQRRAGEQSSWTKVGFVESKAADGTTTETKSYRFEDADLPYAANQLEYRLRQVDIDGSESLSDLVTVQRAVDEVELLGTFPNPTRTRATVRFAVPGQQKVTLELYDVLGRQVRTLVSGEREGRLSMQVDVSDLPSGVYFLRLKAEGQMKTQRLTVVK